MSDFALEPLTPDLWSAVAELIHHSTNAWYRKHGRADVFPGPERDCQLFCEVYEELDPGCCLIAIDQESWRLAGSCFYHPRGTHLSLGIMNVHPDYFQRGVGSRILRHVVDLADRQNKPMRLISSALNLDSFSLYNRAGFRPRMVFQDMLLTVPETGWSSDPADGPRDHAKRAGCRGPDPCPTGRASWPHGGRTGPLPVRSCDPHHVLLGGVEL